MPRNKFGGNKAKKGKNIVSSTKYLVLKDGDEQQYAYVTKMLGDGRLKINCSDGTERMGIIRGKMRKRVWIAVGDLVLISLRIAGTDTFDDNKADVIHLYSPNEVKLLKTLGEYNTDLTGEKDNWWQR